MAAVRIRHVVLVGLMGSGKTTVGCQLAARLDWPFVDSDEQLHAVDGRSAREIEATDGEAALDRLEVAALVRALAEPRPSVIAAAAGVVELPGVLAALREQGLLVVWLHAGPATLAERAASGEHRPWSGSGPLATLEAQARLRDPVYASVADVTVDVTADEAEDVTDRLEDVVRVRLSAGP